MKRNEIQLIYFSLIYTLCLFKIIYQMPFSLDHITSHIYIYICDVVAGKIYGKQPEKKKPAKRQRAASSSTSSISSNENDEGLTPKSYNLLI